MLYQDKVLSIDVLRHRVLVKGKEVKLSPTEFRLLMVLTQNDGIVISVNHLLDLIWGNTEVSEANVREYIYLLRKKLGGFQLIETVREFGYRYNRAIKRTS